MNHYHRFLSIFAIVASLFVVNGVEILRTPSALRVEETGSTEPREEAESGENINIGDDTEGRPMKGTMTIAKGFRCKAGASKRKKGPSKECEGGFKKTTGVGFGAQELAEDIASELEDMHKGMAPVQKSLLPNDDIMMELVSLDEVHDIDFDDEECSDESCKKTVKFGGYFKLFWGCNVTFSKRGRKMSKTIACGGKSFEGMGKKQNGDDRFDPEGLLAEIEF